MVPEGKKRSKRIGSTSNAEKFKRKTKGELAAGTYRTSSRRTWKDLRAEWKSKLGRSLSSQTEKQLSRTWITSNASRQACAEGRNQKAQTIDGYIADRSKDRIRKKGMEP